MGATFSQDQYRNGVQELDKLCRSEYDLGLVDLLNESDRDLTLERLRRLTGILLKQPFAERWKVRKDETVTGSNYAWDWNMDRLRDPASHTSPQYKLLRQVVPESGHMEELAERGVYKFFALWLGDKMKGKETRGFRDYRREPESAEFESLLNIAEWASQVGVAIGLAALAGVPTVAVAVTLIAGKYGTRKLLEATDASER